jgi:hypothetical protein
MLFVPKVYVRDDNNRFADALRGYLRGQWVNVNGMTGRIVNHVGNAVVIVLRDGMLAVYR